MEKEVEHYDQDWSFVEGQLSSKDEMLVVPSNKYKEVGISLKNKDCGFNFSIAKIELHNGTHGSASKVFESATKLGEQIAKRWNEYPNMKMQCYKHLLKVIQENDGMEMEDLIEYLECKIQTL